MKKPTVLFFISLILIGSAIGAALWLHMQEAEQVEPAVRSQPQIPTIGSAPEGEELGNEHGTNSIIYFEGEIPPADPLMVGRWKNADNAGWHKVYYDDDDGEGHYWGKEWDEADDVLEEDLGYHGNGWFRWNKSNDTLIEYSTMDFRDVPIAHIYVIKMKDSVDIAMAETNGRSVFHFIKE